MVSKLFQLFNSVKTQVGILDWGIKMTTLEDGEGGREGGKEGGRDGGRGRMVRKETSKVGRKSLAFTVTTILCFSLPSPSLL